MSLAQLINRPCLIVTRDDSGEEDEYGNQIPTEGAVETVCEAQPRRALEPENMADLSDEDFAGFFLPVDAGYLNAASAVWIPELGEFEVEGLPANWRNPRTQDYRFLHVNLRRTAGPEDELS